MKHFESSGLWSLRDDMSNTVGGTLRYDSEGLNLSLMGSFSEDWAAATGALSDHPWSR